MWDIDEREVRTSRSLQRVPMDRRFNAEAIETISVRPKDLLHRSVWRASGHRERPARLGAVPPETETIAVKRAATGKGLRVTLRDPQKFGRTLVGCKGCNYIGSHGSGVGCTDARSDECHQRIAEQLSLSEEGRDRVNRAIRRKDAARDAAIDPSGSSQARDPSSSCPPAVSPSTPLANPNPDDKGDEPDELATGEVDVESEDEDDDLEDRGMEEDIVRDAEDESMNGGSTAIKNIERCDGVLALMSLAQALGGNKEEESKIGGEACYDTSLRSIQFTESDSSSLEAARTQHRPWYSHGPHDCG